jgi:hypothetical protein
MHKFFELLLLLGLCLNAHAAFDLEPDLVDTLKQRAERNIAVLPDDLRNQYLSYINEYPDGLMAYLISAEKSGILWDANPDDVLSNYLQIRNLCSVENFQQSSEFFLSYIAKITVSHERITAYREEMLRKGLDTIRENNPDMVDRIRATNLWCRENMVFVSTSGRTMDPLSVLNKSKTGRCGEMQVFFISACRSVGIPARPAWTPWWPHTDNNHAWTEVFVNNEWHYVENAQPDYYLDSTWFTSSINKTLLVLAKSSFPDSQDDVVSKSTDVSYVNSSRYYQNTRDIEFTVEYKTGQPADSALVNIFAYNFGMLRPLIGFYCDSLGKGSINIGQGGFFVTASKDSIFDYLHVPFDSSSANQVLILRLDENTFTRLDFSLRYPRAMGIRQDDPEYFAELKQAAAKTHSDKLEEFRQIEIPQWAPGDSTFHKIYETSVGNKEALLNFAFSNRNVPAEFWQRILDLDIKFRWQANLTQWEMIFRRFNELDELEIDDATWINLLSPSIFYEQLPLRSIPVDYFAAPELGTPEKIKSLITLINNRHNIESDTRPDGLLSLDNLLNCDNLGDLHLKTLCCYVLRANNIPASYTRMPNTIQVKPDSTWLNYNIETIDFCTPQDENVHSLSSVEFFIVDDMGLPLSINPDNASLTIFQDGRFFFNDRQLEYDKINSRLYGDLEPGEYQLQICIRETSEHTLVKLLPIEIESTDSIRDTLMFTEYTPSWKTASKDQIVFFNSFLDPGEQDIVLLFGNADNEPVQRLANKIHQQLQNRQFDWYGSIGADNNQVNYQQSHLHGEFLEKFPDLKHRLITFCYSSETNKWMLFEGNWDLLY